MKKIKGGENAQKLQNVLQIKLLLKMNLNNTDDQKKKKKSNCTEYVKLQKKTFPDYQRH